MVCVRLDGRADVAGNDAYCQNRADKINVVCSHKEGMIFYICLDRSSVWSVTTWKCKKRMLAEKDWFLLFSACIGWVEADISGATAL